MDSVIEIRKGTERDTEQFIELMAFVRQSMEHKEWLYLDPPNVVRENMRDGTMSLWAAEDKGRIVAAFDSLYPALKPFNYGYTLGFAQDKLLRVVNMDTAVVHPDYRGFGLQRRLMQEAELEFASTGNRILLCTVHPENLFSLGNVLRQGYAICRTVPMYGSVRHVLSKTIG